MSVRRARVEQASDPLPNASGVHWRSPRESAVREPAPPPKPLYTRARDALAAAGVESPSDLLVAALILAQAIDRHRLTMIDAAAVGKRSAS